MSSSDIKTKLNILLQSPLSAVAANVNSLILIVLDTIDGCGTSETRWNLILFDDIAALPSNYRILVTTKPEGDILPFALFPSPKAHTLNHNTEMGKNRLDVYIYQMQIRKIEIFKPSCHTSGSELGRGHAMSNE